MLALPARERESQEGAEEEEKKKAADGDGGEQPNNAAFIATATASVGSKQPS